MRRVRRLRCRKNARSPATATSRWRVAAGSLLTIGLVAFGLSGCDRPEYEPAVQLVTLWAAEQAEGCLHGATSGFMTEEARSGLGIRSGGRLIAVVWPAGYSAVRIDGVDHLLDHAGQVVARDGDHIRLGGGLGTQGDVWHTCGTVERLND
jgi:hypothetical protein